MSDAVSRPPDDILADVSAPEGRGELEWDEPPNKRFKWVRKSGHWNIFPSHAGYWLMYFDTYMKHCDSIEAAQSLAAQLDAVLRGHNE